MLSALAFLLAFGTLSWLALRRDPVCGVYVYLLTFYVHPPSRWWGPMLPDLRWSFSSAAIALLALWVHRHKLNKPERPFIATVPGLVLVLYALLLWVQNLWALEPEDHLRASILVTKYIVAYYFIYRLADTPQRASGVLLAHVMGCLYLGWLAFNIGRGEGSRLDGVGGPGIDDANTLGTHLVTGFVVGAALVISFVGWRRIAAALSVPLILNGLVLTASRGAFLGLVSGAGLLYVVRPQRRRWMFWVFGLLGLALTARVADDQFIDRMFSIQSAAQGDENIDMSAESRFVIVEAQLRMFLDHPQGVGQKGTAVLSGQYMDEKWLTRGSSDDEGQRSSHNTFMTVLTEQGIPGVLLYLWLSLWGVGAVFRIRSAQRRGADRDTVTAAGAAAAGLAVIWVAGNFADYLLMEAQIWLLAVLALSMDRLRSQAAQVQVGTSQRPAQAQAQAN